MPMSSPAGGARVRCRRGTAGHSHHEGQPRASRSSGERLRLPKGAANALWGVGNPPSLPLSPSGSPTQHDVGRDRAQWPRGLGGLVHEHAAGAPLAAAARQPLGDVPPAGRSGRGRARCRVPGVARHPAGGSRGGVVGRTPCAHLSPPARSCSSAALSSVLPAAAAAAAGVGCCRRRLARRRTSRNAATARAAAAPAFWVEGVVSRWRKTPNRGPIRPWVGE
jgi:hypothetical protein